MEPVMEWAWEASAVWEREASAVWEREAKAVRRWALALGQAREP